MVMSKFGKRKGDPTDRHEEIGIKVESTRIPLPTNQVHSWKYNSDEWRTLTQRDSPLNIQP